VIDIESVIRSSPPDIGAKEFNLCANDAGIDGFIGLDGTVATGQNQVQVILRNQGTNTLNQVNIYLKINNGPANMVTWSGTINPKQAVIVSLGNYSFSSGQIYDLKTWTVLPNGSTDCNNYNDTSKAQVTTPLCGVYTIGGLNPDFLTINDAVEVLNSSGVTCPVQFNIRPGIYNEKIEIFNIPGTSSSNTVTFTSENQDSSSVNIFKTGGGYCLTLNGAKHVIFDKVSIGVMQVLNTSGNLTWRKNKINDYIYLQACSDNLLFEENHLSSGVLTDGGTFNGLVRFYKNRFILQQTPYNICISLIRNAFNAGFEFVENHMEVTSTHEIRAIVLYSSGAFLIENNTFVNFHVAINKSAWGGFHKAFIKNNKVLYPNTRPGTANIGFDILDFDVDIINNYVSMGGQGRNTCLYLSNSFQNNFLNHQILFNTFNLSGTNAANCNIAINSQNKFIFRNNIINNTGFGNCIISNFNFNSTTDIDYNDYYQANGTLAIYNGQLATNLNAWQALIQKDANSKSENPAFVLPKPTLPANRLLNGAGIAAGGVLLDIDGEIRNQSAPDPGCDEFMVDFGITRLENPTLACEQGDSVPVVVYLTQFGDIPFINVKIAYQVDDGPIFMDTIPGSISNDLTYTFNQIQDLTQNGVYQFKIWLVDNSDDNINNDTLRVTRYSQPSPVVTFTSGSGCAGTAIPFNGSASISQGSISRYEWDFGDGSIDSIPVTSHAFDISGDYPVTLYAFSNSGCYGSTRDTVTVLNTPIASFTPDYRCANDSIELVNTTTRTDSMSIFEWRTDNVINSILENPEPFVLQAGNYSLSLTVTNQNGCIDSASTLIEVLPLPLVTLPDFGPFCSDNGPVFITGGMPAGGLYQGAALVNRYFDPATSGPGLYEITYTYTDSAGCTGRGTDSIQVFGTPEVTISLSGDSTICYGDSIFLQASGAFSYVWSDGTTGATKTLFQTGTYNCVGTNASGCTAVSSSIEITVLGDSVPDSTLIVNICSGNSYTLPNGQVIDSSGQFTFIFSGTQGCDSIVFFDIHVNPTSQSSTTVVTCRSYTWNGQTYSQTGTYTYTTTNAAGCDSIATLNLTITPLTITTSSTPASSSISNDGTATVVVSSGIPPYSYSWNTTPLQTTQTAINLSPGNYTVSITDATSCSATASVEVGQSNEQCEPFRTYGKGGWGAVNNGFNPGTYLVNNFAAAYPNGLQIGSCNRLIKLTNAAAVIAFLPTSATPTRLPNTTQVNPTASSYANTLAGHLVALNLNITFDSLNPGFAGSTVWFKNALVASGPFAGHTVQQLYDEANQAIGCSNNKTYLSRLNRAIDSTNASWRNGTRRNNFIVCPNSVFTRSSEEIEVYDSKNAMRVTAYPNPSSGIIQLQAEGDLPERIEVHNMLGGVILNCSWKSEIDLSSAPEGLYILRVVFGDNYFEHHRMILKR
jgi:PKD repeat protein